MSRTIRLLTVLLSVVGLASSALAFPDIAGGKYDNYARALNLQVWETSGVANGETYWRVHKVATIPPPDTGFGSVDIYVKTIDENGTQIYGIPVRFFATYGGQTFFTQNSAADYSMTGGNWTNPFYDHVGPYACEIDDGTHQSEVLAGCGLPANQHWSYSITFQRATKGTTPTYSQPDKRGLPFGKNLLTNPGAETGDLTGWTSTGGWHVDGTVFNNSGSVNGTHHFTFDGYGTGSSTLTQSGIPVEPGKRYSMGCWLVKKAISGGAQMPVTISWSDNNGGSGTLYSVAADAKPYNVYWIIEGAIIEPQGDTLTIDVDCECTSNSAEFAFHFDEFWVIPEECYTGGTDTDSDGVMDVCDNCIDDANADPYKAVPTQPDSDGDGIGDACDACDNNAGSVEELFASYSFESGTDGFTLNTADYCGAGGVQRSTTGGSSAGTWHVWAPGVVREGTCNNEVELMSRSVDTTGRSNLFARFDLKFDDYNAFETSDYVEFRVNGVNVLHVEGQKTAGWLTFETNSFPASAENGSASIALWGLTSATEETFRIDNIRVYQFTPDVDDDGDGVRNACDLCPNTPGGTPVDGNGCPLVTTVWADFNGDSDVDVSDFARFQVCFSGPGGTLPEPSCDEVDHDGDNDVDVADFAAFQQCFSGPNQTPACSP